MHDAWNYLIDGSRPRGWAFADWILAIAIALAGLVMVVGTSYSNYDAGHRLRQAAPLLEPSLRHRYLINIRLRWGTTYFILTGEGWWAYRAWQLWHYHWHNLPHEVLVFDAMRLSGFVALGVLWFVAAKA